MCLNCERFGLFFLAQLRKYSLAQDAWRMSLIETLAFNSCFQPPHRSSITETKNASDGLVRRLDMVEERISQLEDL